MLFLQHLIPSELREVSIGKCIAQAARPRLMLASTPFGNGVDIDKSFATRRHLALLGLSFSSDQVKLLKQPAAVSDSMEATETEHFTQWVGDKVDHNIRALTGKGTFHDMGIISIRSNSNSNFKEISRRHHKLVKNFADGGVKFEPYYGDNYRGLQKL